MSRGSQILLLLAASVLAAPVLAVLAALAQSATPDVLGHMLETVLPRYALTSVLLCVLVGVGTAVIGLATACAVTVFDFKGRRLFEWALLLPLAMPAYVSAYAYTDFLQYSGTLQTWLRSAFGLQGRLLPEIRSVGGAALLLILTLYPYVYVLARAALSERAGHLMEAARLLGAPLKRQLKSVALPLARPAVAAGVALALMETLADFGVASYFGIQTFSAGIYKAWLSMDDRVAAAQLCCALLLVVVVLLKLEHRAQKKMRFTSRGGAAHGSAQSVRLQGKQQLAAQLVCLLPLLLGFVLPVLLLLRTVWAAPEVWQIDGSQFGSWVASSLKLATISAVLTVALALWLAFAQRRSPTRLTRGVVQLVGLGYAVPGAVLVVGLLTPVALLQVWQPSWSVGSLLTTTVVGVVWAYMVRFSAVALQSVQSGYSRIPASVDDSARMLGARGLRLLSRIHLPLLSRSVLAAGLLVFVDVMKELPATLVLRPFDHDTLAVVAYNLAKDERLAEAALPSLCLVVVGLIPVVLLSRSMRNP
jgi:iron(III) transport system permease protein